MGASCTSHSKGKLQPAAPMAAPIDHIDHAFQKADKDANGSIDCHELVGAMAALGIPADSFELALETMRRYDRDGDGVLQQDEFRTLAQEVERYVQDAEASFARYDADGNGRIDVRELFEALSALGLAESLQHAQQVMAKFSIEKSPNGTLGLQEYRKVVDKCRAFQKHKSTFRRYDVDGSGSIDRNELYAALLDLGLMSSREHARQVFRRFDLDGSGSLQVPEFIKLADAICTFKQFDRDGDGVVNIHECHYALQSLHSTPSTFAQTMETMRRFDKDGDGALQLFEFLELVDDVHGQSSKDYTHVSFCNGTCGGQCNPMASYKKPPRLPSAPLQPLQQSQLPPQPQTPSLQPLQPSAYGAGELNRRVLYTTLEPKSRSVQPAHLATRREHENYPPMNSYPLQRAS